MSEPNEYWFLRGQDGRIEVLRAYNDTSALSWAFEVFGRGKLAEYRRATPAEVEHYESIHGRVPSVEVSKLTLEPVTEAVGPVQSPPHSEPREDCFYYDREELENLAAAVEANVQFLCSERVRSGDYGLDQLMQSFERIESFCRELIEEADCQRRWHVEPHELGIERDAARHILYGVLHAIASIKDGKEETLTGDEPHKVLTQLSCGLWISVGRWETERRREVYDRIDLKLAMEDVPSGLLAGFRLPEEWASLDQPVPEE